MPVKIRPLHDRLIVERTASRRIVTICSLVNRVFFMAPSASRGRHSLKRQLARKSPGRSLRRCTRAASWCSPVRMGGF